MPDDAIPPSSQERDFPTVVARPAALPEAIDGYRILRRLDSGGQAIVYEAQQENPPRKVAIKVLRGDRASNFAQDRFRYEAELLARVSHPGIVKVFSTGTWDPGTGPMPYIVMEYVGGAWPITQYVENAKLPLRERLKLMVDVCDAVQHAHVHGIIHRDIKPGNVLVDAQGLPRLIDFGVARGPKEDFRNRKETLPGQIVGTMVYLAPEQTLGDQGLVDARADVYALGLLLYRLVCGRMPYEVDDVDDDTARRVIREASPVRPSRIREEVSEDLDAVILTALAKEPEDRYQSARDLSEDISRLLEGRSTRAKVPGAWRSVRAMSRRVVSRHRRSATLLAAGLGGLAGVFLTAPIINLFVEGLFQAGLARVAHPPRPPTMLDNVRVIGLSNDTRILELAEDFGLSDVVIEKPKTHRGLHGLVMERLADAGVRTVVLDMVFGDATDHDEPIHRAMDALAAQGIDVVCAKATWEQETAREYAPEFLGRMLTGTAISGVSAWAMWRVELALTRNSVDALPSLALAAYASTQYPGRQFRYEVEPWSAVVRVRPGRIEDGRDRSWIDSKDKPLEIRCTNVRSVPGDERAGIEQGDGIFEYFLDLPPQPDLDAVFFDYAQVLRASPEEVRGWFEGCVVFLADVRTPSNDHHNTPDGRTLHGVWMHAIALDSLMTGRMIRMASGWQQWVVIGLVSVIGLGLAIWAPWAMWRRIGAWVILTGAATGGSVALFSTWGVLLNPVVPACGTLVAGELAALVRRVRSPLG